MDGGDDVAEREAGLSLTSPRPEADDDVHFGVAARALGVSRKTVERMVKRGELERGPSNAAATVSKRALVATLEARRRDVSHLARATEIERSTSTNVYAAASPQAATSTLTELAPLLPPLLDSSWRHTRRDPGKRAGTTQGASRAGPSAWCAELALATTWMVGSAQDAPGRAAAVRAGRAPDARRLRLTPDYRAISRSPRNNKRDDGGFAGGDGETQLAHSAILKTRGWTRRSLGTWGALSGTTDTARRTPATAAG
jgi:hypothetical protein